MTSCNARPATVSEQLYKARLLQHFKRPNNRGGLAGADYRARGWNPLCGDEIEVAVFCAGRQLRQVRFEGRGCSVCIASASMMTEAAAGLDRARLRRLIAALRGWLAGASPEYPAALPAGLLPLAPVRELPARGKCVLLCWDALEEALGDAVEAR